MSPSADAERDAERAGAPWAYPLVVAAATVAVFASTLGHGFVNWDDQLNFVDNPHYRGLGWPQLRWMLTSAHAGHWIPLTWLTLGLDHALWGMDPRGYHATNVALHAAAALAFYVLAERLLALARPEWSARDRRLGAAAAALLFGVHPLRAESVAWITERRDVLSGLFYVTALLAWLRGVAAPAAGHGARTLALVLFTAATLAKSSAVVLPAVLVVLDVFPLRRLGGARGWGTREVWLEKLSLFLVAAMVGTLAMLAVLANAYLRPLDEMGLGFRAVLSVYGLAFYLLKSVAPVGLSPLYQLPITVTWLHFAGVLGLAGLAIAMRRRWPALAAAGAAYVLTLLPVLGPLQNGPQVVADRYSYLSCLPWAMLAGAAVACPWRGARVVRAVAAIWIVALALLGAQQAAIWRDSVSLWGHAVTVDPAGRAAHTLLGRALAAQGRTAAAVTQYAEALERSSNPTPYHVLIAQTLEQGGFPASARAHFLEAARRQPALPEACAGLARLAGGARPPAAAAYCPAGR